MPTIDEVSDRVKIINALEEPGRCSQCSYCFFLRKLETRLQELNFFTTNAHVKRWDVKYRDDILTVKPIEASSSLD